MPGTIASVWATAHLYVKQRQHEGSENQMQNSAQMTCHISSNRFFAIEWLWEWVFLCLDRYCSAWIDIAAPGALPLLICLQVLYTEWLCWLTCWIFYSCKLIFIGGLRLCLWATNVIEVYSPWSTRPSGWACLQTCVFEATIISLANASLTNQTKSINRLTFTRKEQHGPFPAARSGWSILHSQFNPPEMTSSQFRCYTWTSCTSYKKHGRRWRMHTMQMT